MDQCAGNPGKSPFGAWYSLPEVAQKEWETLFPRHWTAAVATQSVENPKIGLEIDHFGHPVHIRKDTQRGWVAISQTCRHRGATVRPRANANSLCFVCPYHGWTYSETGERIFCPEWPEAAGADQPGLAPWDCHEWAGFIWLKTGETDPPGQNISPPWENACFKPDEFALGELQWMGTWRDELACDWKVFVDNYLDGGYHLGPVHPELTGALDSAAYQTIVSDRSVLQWAPSAVGEGVIADVRSGNEARYWWLWPNFFWNHYGDCLDTNIVIPAGPGRCRVRFDFFFLPRGRFSLESQRSKSIETAKLIQEQDRMVCESVQKGMESGEYKGGPYHPIREVGMRRFHEIWRASLGLSGEES